MWVGFPGYCCPRYTIPVTFRGERSPVGLVNGYQGSTALEVLAASKATSQFHGDFYQQIFNSILPLLVHHSNKMIIRASPFALGAYLLLISPLASCLSPSDIPSGTPISSLVSSAKANLAQGKSNDALTYFDVAVSRDPKNYLTIFQRGATYLSLGKNAQAKADFDRVLLIKPDFEGALLQRAKINSKNADWEAAKSDYRAARKTESVEYTQLEEAQGAALLAADAAKAGDWEACISHAGTAIYVASSALALRQLRANCRFERGEVLEGASDLQHVLQLSPRSVNPHLQISSMLFYSVGDREKGLAQIRKCLHSDPDSKACSKLYRREKQVDKLLKQVYDLKEKKKFSNAVKVLAGAADDTGLIDMIKEDVRDAKVAGTIPKNSPNELYASIVETACELYVEVCSGRNRLKILMLTTMPDEQQEKGSFIL